MKQSALFLLLAAMTLLAPFAGYAADDDVAGKCMTCHKEKSPGLYNQWYSSEHAQHGVTCYDCHKAARGEADSFMHEGARIATLVTPNDCGVCHAKETREFTNSYHAQAGKILESKDAYMAHVVGGEPAAIVGCASCHGAKMVIDESSPNKLSPKNWPNSGVGRINPDGSLGSCNACHSRHSFSRALARRPENCGKCHLGPDHPQKEIYEESKHGIAFHAHEDKMNLEAERWVVGVDYYEAPSCASCHLSATKNQPMTHDAGQRLSWTTRPPISKRKENWQAKRDNMQDVCVACHSKTFVEGHYLQYDALVNLYDEKFGKPATEMMKILRENGSLENEASFSNDIEWVYWEIWHHEGRRARHGAAMMGPDYAWWHGIYEVGKHFYFELIPLVRETGDEEAIAYLDELLQHPMHSWLSQDTATLKKAIRSGELQKRYGKFFTAEYEGQ